MIKKVKGYLITVAAASAMLVTTVPVMANVTPEFKVWYENGEEYGAICAIAESGERLIDEAVVAPAMQLSNFSLLEGKDYFYFVDNSMIKAYSYETGELAWINYEFCGSVAMECYAVDDENNLYVAGYFGPDLMVIDAEGNTVSRIDTFSNDVYWPYAMELKEDGTVDITYESDGGIRNFNPADYEGQVEEAKYEGMIAPFGTPMEVYKCNEYITLRVSANTSAQEITRVPLGADVTYLHSAGNGFAYIAFQNYRGCVLEEYLKVKEDNPMK